MTGRSIDIALTQAEAGDDLEIVYENVCTLSTEPELCFNYATTAELKEWKFLEGCFSSFLRDKKDVIIQVITTYQQKEGAASAYNADVDYFKKNNYGRPVKSKSLGEASVLFKKKQSDGITYNLLFLKNNVFAAVSAKYKIEKSDNLDHIFGLAEKIESKIP
ncbi:Uncharacterised protein [uncultured archaeon]|nr:Uncharacterised protein [uncultured archaeon]